jgi:hypothetical protein
MDANGLQPGADEAEIDAGDAIDDSTDSDVEVAPQETDQFAELRAQVGAAARRDEFERLQNQVRSELGRSQRLEARLDAMAGANPLADVDPRLDANENLLNSIAEALIDSDLTDDRMKSALRASRSALDTARGARAQGRMREELKAEILSALPQPAAASPDSSGLWAAATQDVLAELAENLPDFDVQTIPATVWNEGRAKGTPTRAAAYVLRWAQQQATEPATVRTATRRQAAGAGSPARQGAAGASITDIKDADAAYNTGLITHDQYKTERERLLLGVAPGGGR